MTSPESALRRPGRERRAQWELGLALLLLLVVGCGALAPLLRGTGWWWAMALVAAAVLLGCAVLRRLGVVRSLVPVAALGILLAMLTLLFGGGTGLLWLVPTPETIDRFQGLVDSGLTSIQRQSTPAEAIPGMIFLLAAGAGLIGILMDVLAVTFRWPALAGLPVLVPIAVPGLLVEGGADPLALVFTASAYLVLLRVDVRVRRSAEARHPFGGGDSSRVFAPVPRRGPGPLWGAITVGSIGVVSALVLSTSTPVITDGGLFGGGGTGVLFGAGVSPLIDLGEDLRRPQAGPALHYTTTADSPPYLKLLTLDQFVGTTWTARSAPADTSNTVDDIGEPPGLSPQVETTQTRTGIVIDGVQTNLLPTPAPPKRVVGLDGTWYWNSSTLTIASTDTTTRGQQYTVTAIELKPTAAQLRDSTGRYPSSVAQSLRLPPRRPAIIEQTAKAVTRGTDSSYDAAVALQDYLRSGVFSYDTEAPVDAGYDGGGADVIGTFLKIKKGYCVHFASAMAIMARTLGIPARISLGYLPGAPSTNAEEGVDRFNVDSHDLHAWPELYFVGVGWVPFEPTPGRGTVPDYAQPADVPLSTSTPGATAPTSAPRSGDPGIRADTGSANPSSGRQSAAATLLNLGALLALVLAVLLAPGGTRAIRRARRRYRIRSGRGGPADAWAELCDTAIDHGVRVSDTETPRELVARLSTLPGLAGGPGADPSSDGGAALERLLVATERHRYDRPGRGEAPEAGAALADDLDRVIRTIHSGADRPARWRATALPASLWPAALGRRNGRTPQGA